jgi:hypothetical protein
VYYNASFFGLSSKAFTFAANNFRQIGACPEANISKKDDALTIIFYFSSVDVLFFLFGAFEGHDDWSADSSKHFPLV